MPGVFADEVRNSDRRYNRDGKEHTQRTLRATMSYDVVENKRRFHRVAEQIRLSMLAKLAEEGAPINVWRVGALNGIPAVNIDLMTGESMEWKNEHTLSFRTRASVETPWPINEE